MKVRLIANPLTDSISSRQTGLSQGPSSSMRRAFEMNPWEQRTYKGIRPSCGFGSVFWGRLGAVLTMMIAAVTPAQPIRLEIVHQTTPGRSVFVTGEHPLLGGGDISRAPKLSPTSYPNWFLPLDLPAGTQLS